jgi:hypothetical protein
MTTVLSQMGSVRKSREYLVFIPLAIRFNLKLVECSIANVAIHPLDGIETEDDYREYIDRINKNFTIPQALPFPQNAIVTRVRKSTFIPSGLLF